MAEHTGGRILHEEGTTRFVEISQTFDSWSTIPVQQIIARLQHSYYGQERLVTLQRPDEEDSSRIKTFTLSFEELNTLVAAYQTFLADREEASRSSDRFYQSYNSLDDHPF